MIRCDAIHLNEERITNVALACSSDGLGRGSFERWPREVRKSGFQPRSKWS